MKRKIQKPRGTEEKLKKVVFDTSAIIDGKIVELAEKGELDSAEVIIPEIVIGELRSQASRGREIGFAGLAEIKKLRDSAEKHKINLRFVGERPSYEDILLAKSGRIDALIQDIAKSERAVLATSDLPQALVAEAEGLSVKYFEPFREKKIKLEKFLTEDTMSLHLKEGAIPYAKRGRPGKIELMALAEKPVQPEEIDGIIKEIMEVSRYEEEAFLEISEQGVTVIQLRDMRIAIARPPFSDGLEVTLVRPIIKLRLEDYKLSPKLKERLTKKAEGLLIAGPPGSGKSSFVASLAEHYLKQGKIVKTLESPRDLQVPPEITQYAPLAGSFVKTSDILLLVRPDYTVFDEVRKPSDFSVFTDMRLAGIGMMGVIHATDPIDAVQRFIGRVELGVIPHVIDTIVYIKDGEIKKVYSLALTVRVPYGMSSADLARPVVEVKDFESGRLEYEIYTFGEENVVIPIKEERKHAMQRLAQERIMDEIRRFDRSAEIEFLSEDKIAVKVRNEVIPRLIGKEGKTVTAIEKKLGIHIEVQPAVESLGREVRFEIGETGAYLVLVFDKRLAGKNANVYIENEYLFTATVGRTGQIRVSKDSDLGKNLLRTITSKRQIKVFI